MINKGKYMVLLLCLAGGILGGCGSSSALAGAEAERKSGIEIVKSSQEVVNTGLETGVKEQKKNFGQKGISGINQELFDGSEMDMWYGNENTLLVLKGKQLYLYDVQSAEILAKTDTKQWDTVCFYSFSDGYAAIGAVMEGKEPRPVCIFFDRNLKEKKNVAIDKLVSDVWTTAWAVSADGSMLAYYDFYKGLNLYDVEKEKNTQLLDVSGAYEDRLNILAMDSLFFEKTGTKLVFSAQTTKNNVTVESWGKINLDGSGLENHILDKNAGTAIGYQDEKLLYGEDSLMFAGLMGYVDTATQKQKWNTEIKGGSNIGGPIFSKNGETFAAVWLNKNSLQLAVYQTSDFSLLYQQEITDVDEQLFYRLPHMYLFEELDAGLVFLGGHNGIATKTETVAY